MPSRTWSDKTCSFGYPNSEKQAHHMQLFLVRIYMHKRIMRKKLTIDSSHCGARYHRFNRRSTWEVRVDINCMMVPGQHTRTCIQIVPKCNGPSLFCSRELVSNILSHLFWVEIQFICSSSYVSSFLPAVPQYQQHFLLEANDWTCFGNIDFGVCGRFSKWKDKPSHSMSHLYWILILKRASQNSRGSYYFDVQFRCRVLFWGKFCLFYPLHSLSFRFRVHLVGNTSFVFCICDTSHPNVNCTKPRTISIPTSMLILMTYYPMFSQSLPPKSNEELSNALIKNIIFCNCVSVHV